MNTAIHCPTTAMLIELYGGLIAYHNVSIEGYGHDQFSDHDAPYDMIYVNTNLFHNHVMLDDLTNSTFFSDCAKSSHCHNSIVIMLSNAQSAIVIIFAGNK